MRVSVIDEVLGSIPNKCSHATMIKGQCVPFKLKSASNWTTSYSIPVLKILSDHSGTLGHCPHVIIFIACIHGSTSINEQPHFIFVIYDKTDIQIDRRQRVVNRDRHWFFVRRREVRNKNRNSEKTRLLII